MALLRLAMGDLDELGLKNQLPPVASQIETLLEDQTNIQYDNDSISHIYTSDIVPLGARLICPIRRERHEWSPHPSSQY